MSFLTPTHGKRFLFFIGFDVLLSIISFVTAYFLRFNFDLPEEMFSGMLLATVILVPLKILFLAVQKIYMVAWRFFGLMEAKRIFIAHIDAYILFILIYYLFQDAFTPFPRSVIVIDFFLSILFIGLLRASKRIYLEGSSKSGHNKAIIIGATNQAQHIVKSYFMSEIPYYPASIVDSDPKVIGTYISNIRVHHLESLERIIKRDGIDCAIIASRLEGVELDRMFERLKAAGINEIKLTRVLEDRQEPLKELSIEDLLARKPKDLDKEAIEAFIQNQRILITGAGGSIGSEIVRQCVFFGAKELILVENSEFALYTIVEELKTFPSRNAMISVSDEEALNKVFSEQKPDIVIHAAAYKHVPLCEENIDSAFENNITGSKNVIDLSIRHRVKKLVIISTDKAVRPTNVMGATKRVAELYAQNVDSGSTEIVSVRFGNVLGSSGSVVPKFKEQILNGGPVTVTDPEVRRYFMLIPEACQLVLQAGAIAKGGEVFILDMGEPVKISDLAEKMIRLYGKEEEVKIIFTGLRPGEKLYEELLISESQQKTRYESIYVGSPTDYPIEKLKSDIDMLFDSDNKIQALQNIVPEFTHQPNS